MLKKYYEKLVPEAAWGQDLELINQLKEIIAETAGIPAGNVTIEEPKSSEHGEHSTNIALIEANKQGQNPREIAQNLQEKLLENDWIKQTFAKLEVAGPGFINFFIKTEKLAAEMQTMLATENLAQLSTLTGKRILFEYAHPNPFKVFHIGHLRNIILGESLVRLLENSGAEVIRTNYQGDVGMHIAKSIWGMLQLMEQKSLTVDQLEQGSDREKVDFLGEAYALGAKAFADDEAKAEEIKDINRTVYAVAQEIEMEKYDWQPQTKYKDFIETENYDFEEIKKLWTVGVKWSLNYLRNKIYTRLYSSFKREYMESETQYYAEKNFLRAKEAGLLTLSDGAYILDGKKYGIDTRVYINSLGLPTYEGKELGLAPLEATDYGEIDLFIHNVAVEQISYFKSVFTLLENLDPDLYKDKKYHNAYEFVGLKSGKMSSRTGDVVKAEDILNEAVDLIEEKVAERDLPDKDDVVEKIAIGAVKYSFLNINPGSYLAFDLESSINFEGESGPYLQYTYARANKMLLEAGEVTGSVDLALLVNEKEQELQKLLLKFQRVIADATQNLAPNTLASYLFEVAQAYNSFYKVSPVLKEENSELKRARLALTKLTTKVIKQGLDLLGIKVVEQM